MNTTDPKDPAIQTAEHSNTAPESAPVDLPSQASVSSTAASADADAAPAPDGRSATDDGGSHVRLSRARRAAAVAALPVAGVLVVAGLFAALVFAGMYGYRWYDDAENKVPVQTARDDALGGAEQAMLNILNIDLKQSDAYQKRLQASVTGNAQQQLLGSTGLDELQKQAGDPANAATLTAKLQRSGLVSLEPDENSATALVFLNVTSSRPGQASASQTMGFQVAVTKNQGVWRANNIQPLDAVAIDSTDAGGGAASAPAAPSGQPAPAPGGN